MRTEKRFTPDLLARFERLERGQGTHEKYIPWHRVGRGDPASIGRSHLHEWRGRHCELLSDKELIYYFFTTMLKNIYDVREQFPLTLERSEHELSKYRIGEFSSDFPGTVEIAGMLNFKHPKCHGNKKSVNWRMTTDFLLTFVSSNGEVILLALAVKLDGEVDKKRTRQLLAIERQYWIERNVEWLLLTPVLYHPLVADLLSCTRYWGLSSKVEDESIKFAVSHSMSWEGRSLTFALNDLTEKFGDLDYAQRIFWQAVWSGRLRLELRRGWRPHEPLRFLSEEAFGNLNPVAARRSAWI
ncbi:MAG: TnsA endonuclease N-terminal domain-containing protein [Undibacterium sp.]|uniref:TnsA endonuclease N-terminal domain-containing protein n=1 Tax=Undibacterium sp. TaxID=1914977 RepID=UPI002727C1C3|nr:TnsA endonuclease N-terminal domain-containing protein [Undibacterium sp.]MDO8653477.1 TnsA endonuclease N-terminal domain-containing protein [Undibacterium sp.]